MASGRTDQRVNQDYIARIRYSNVLPPPPNPPKLLEIPNDALKHYTSATFGSRLHRDQPINIEADSELGMPIDLLGIPGVFEGDEKALYGRDHPPIPHPHDKALLRPLSVIQKGAGTGAGFSYLRSNEFLSSESAQKRTDMSALKPDRKRRRIEVPREDDPIRMVRDIVKGFDLAYPEDIVKGNESVNNVKGNPVQADERKAWNNPKHPSNPKLELLDSYPLLPDRDAVPDTGAYVIARFSTNPGDATRHYENRLDNAILKPREIPGAAEEIAAAKAANEADDSVHVPEVVYDYDYYLPNDDDLENLNKVLDLQNPDRDDPLLLPDGQEAFGFDRIRRYETQQQQSLKNESKTFDQTIVIALNDDEKTAWMYPINIRMNIRPKRQDSRAMTQAEDEYVDRIEMQIRDMDPEMEEEIRAKHEMYFEPGEVSKEDEATTAV